MAKGIYISDSIHGLTRLSSYEKKVIASVGFNRLHDVYQNSTVYLTYPSNRTKRFEHSIGTMRLCSEMFFNSVTNTEPETLKQFYDIYKRKLEEIIKSLKDNREYEGTLQKNPTKIPSLEWDNFQYSLIPSNVPKMYEAVHEILIQAIRVAALLHDIGHPPYSHVIERAMKVAFKEYEKLAGGKETKYIETMNKYIGEEKKLHEVMGDEISRSILKGILMKTKETGKPDEILFEILILETVLKIYEDEEKFQHLHRIIDSSLDGDRLDYVTRDPANSGMNVGSIDYNRIIMDMRIVVKDNKPYFCIPLKAVNAVEDFLKRRYDLYKNIIFHHRVIKTDYLMEHAVANLIKEYYKIEKTEELEEEKETIPFDISGLWAPLGIGALKQRDCILSQWNDSWLITVLKKIYYEQYYEIDNEDITRYVISKQFAELLNNQRNYITVIKRNEDFIYVDREVRKVLLDNKESLQNKINNLNQKSEQYIKNNEDSAIKMLNVDEFLKQIVNPLTQESVDDSAFIMAKILHLKNTFLTNDIEEKMKHIVEEVCREKLMDKKFLDCIVVFKQITSGLEPEKQIFFSDNSGKPISLDEASSIDKVFRTENLYRPVFYLYILVDGDKDETIKKKGELLSEIGKRIGEIILETINARLYELIKPFSI